MRPHWKESMTKRKFKLQDQTACMVAGGMIQWKGNDAREKK